MVLKFVLLRVNKPVLTTGLPAAVVLASKRCSVASFHEEATVVSCLLSTAFTLEAQCEHLLHCAAATEDELAAEEAEAAGDSREASRPGTASTRTAQLASLAEQADLRCAPPVLPTTQYACPRQTFAGTDGIGDLAGGIEISDFVGSCGKSYSPA